MPSGQRRVAATRRSGASSQDRQVVPVHHFALVRRPQLAGQLVGGTTQQAGQLGGVVVHQSAGHHLALRVDQVHRVAGNEAAEHLFKRGATDFSSQVARMKDAGCDFVVLGTIIRETIGTIGTARKLGWGVDFMGSSAAYTELIHKLGGPAMNGFYATNTINMPYLDDASTNVRGWAQRYKDKYKEDAGVFSVYGYQVIDVFIQVATKTGANLTTDNFIKTLDNFTSSRDMFGADTMSFTKTKHLGSNRARLSQIVNGKWTPLTDYITD